MKEQIRNDPATAAAAERQMRRWSLRQEIADEKARATRFDQPHRDLGDYITISREAGAGGSEVARRIAERLGWEVLDKKLIDLIAEHFHLSRSMLEMVDETASNWAYDILGSWMDPKLVTHEKFVVCLEAVVHAAARRGNVVLVGRGAHFLLPRDQGLSVRIIASEKYRLRRMMQIHGYSEAEARRHIEELERGRWQFVMRYFHHDIHDPHFFDLVIETDRLGPEGAADLIVETYQRWYAHQFAGAAASAR